MIISIHANEGGVGDEDLLSSLLLLIYIYIILLVASSVVGLDMLLATIYILYIYYCQGMTILTRMNAKREEDPKEVRGYIQSIQLFP